MTEYNISYAYKYTQNFILQTCNGPLENLAELRHQIRKLMLVSFYVTNKLSKCFILVSIW